MRFDESCTLFVWFISTVQSYTFLFVGGFHVYAFTVCTIVSDIKGKVYYTYIYMYVPYTETFFFYPIVSKINI